MNVLLLEDESRMTTIITEALTESSMNGGWSLSLRTVSDRDAALALLDDAAFPLDLAVLDLQVPASPDPAPADRKYGLDVFRAIQDRSKGTKVIVFSGRADGPAHTQLMAAAWTADPLGLGESEGMVDFVDKEDIDGCITRVERYAFELEELERIAISYGAERVELNPLEQRILRIYARRLAAPRVRVLPVKAGRSGARTIRLHLYRDSPQPFASLVAKIDTLAEVEREVAAYNAHVAPRLAVGGFPQYADRVDAGAASLGAAFFRLAEDFANTAFDVVEQGELAPDVLVGTIQDRTSGWHDARALRKLRVRDIRRILLPDSRLGEVERFLAATPWRDVETIQVDCHVSSQHCDLHLLNLLVNGRGDIVVIDCASAADAPASLDPITLELCLAFHPDITPSVGGWPSPPRMNDWWDLDRYLADCPFPGLVRASREWAHAMAAGDEEIAAVVYAYALRQLRWPAGRELALPLIGAAVPFLT
jgi:DNA-binding response OmpR family regulator